MRSFLLGGLPKQSTQSRPLSADYPYSYPEYESDPGLFAPISSDGATGSSLFIVDRASQCSDFKRPAIAEDTETRRRLGYHKNQRRYLMMNGSLIPSLRLKLVKY